MTDSIDKKKMKERREPTDQRRGDVRSEYDRDEARLIHSAAFRRLQSKTQVLGLGESDFYRTRLTHSMEVAQIGRGIVQYLSKKKKFKEHKDHLPDISLITAICLAHDIGHPPFGHGGEVALNYCMRNYGGFEGNGQTLRILGKLDKYTADHGLNPTRRMLLGVLKYPAAYSGLVNNRVYESKQDTDTPYWLFKADSQKPPKCYHDTDKDIVDFVFKGFSPKDVKKFVRSKPEENKHDKTCFKSLDCSIMNLADNISYSLHDLEDALSLGMINQAQWENHFKSKTNLFNNLSNELGNSELKFDNITKRLFSNASHERKNAIGCLVHLMITNVIIEDNGSRCKDPLLRYEVKLKSRVEQLREHIFNIVFDIVIKDENVQQLEFKGQKLIIELFQVLSEDPKRFLPKPTKKIWIEAKEDASKYPEKYLSQSTREKFEQEGKNVVEKAQESAQMRVICDFIAGMTDDYATKFYEKFFTPNKGSIFDRL